MKRGKSVKKLGYKEERAKLKEGETDEQKEEKSRKEVNRIKVKQIDRTKDTTKYKGSERDGCNEMGN